MALLSEKADVQYNPEDTDPERVAAEIRDLGFGADLIPEQDAYQDGKLDIIVS